MGGPSLTRHEQLREDHELRAMDRICGKCGTNNPEATWDAAEACPRCGAVYAKVEQHLQVTADKSRADGEAREAAAAKAEEKRRIASERTAQNQAVATRRQEQRLNQSLICKTCGTTGETKTAAHGSTGVEVVLWILALTVIGLPVAIVYSVWRVSTKHKVCRACRSAELIPVGTPIGQQLYVAVQRRA